MQDNQILYLLEKMTDATQFEELCTTLMLREGYMGLVPLGGNYDNGSDAELNIYQGKNSRAEKTIFQYSYEEDWERKLARELKKLDTRGFHSDFYVFVTSRSIITNQKRATLKKEYFQKYNLNLIFFDQKWFKMKLTETDKDLTLKYLGIDYDNEFFHKKVFNKPETLDTKELAWQLYNEEKYEEAIPQFKKLYLNESKNKNLLVALAWCQYSIGNYKPALLTIENAISIAPRDRQARGIKGCILTEYGIKENSELMLTQALKIFKLNAQNSNRWLDHYNLGNVLSSLRKNKLAEKAYLKAIGYNPRIADIWKNLGTIYFQLHEHQKEMECYDKALALDENLYEALSSKALTLIKVYEKYPEAISLLEQCKKFSTERLNTWPGYWYWYSYSLYKSDFAKQALEILETGIRYNPELSYMHMLKREILSSLWPENKNFRVIALAYLKDLLTVDNKNISLIREIAQILQNEPKKNTLNKFLMASYLNDFITIQTHTFDTIPISEFVDALDVFDDYIAFRKISNLDSYIDFLKSSNLSITDDLKDELFLRFLIMYKAVFLQLHSCYNSDNIPSNQEIKVLHTSFAKNLSQVSPSILPSDLSKSNPLTPELITDILIFLPEIGLRELSRMIGYWSGILKMNNQKLTESVIEEIVPNWNQVYVESILKIVDEKFSLFGKNKK